MNRHLSPQEVVRRFGVSIKALRLYERHGLLTPLRSEAGWRTYGPAQVARLHQVLILKRLGLPLVRIAQLLAGRDDLDAVLALQEQVLARQSRSLVQALTLLQAARAKLASGAALSIDDLINLNKETVMTTLTDFKEEGQLLKPFIDRHLSESEWAALRANPMDRDALRRERDELIAEAQRLMETGDPASPAAQNLRRRWRAMRERFSGGDDTILNKTRAAWNEALTDPEVASRLAHLRAVADFMEQVAAHARAQEK